MGIPVVYRKDFSRNIASYSFNDIVQGSSVGSFYLLTAKDSTATTTYSLTQQIIDSQESFSTIPSGGALNTKLLDIDFDLEVKKPVTIKGTVVMAFMASINATYGGSGPNVFVIVKFRKWDGITETELGSGKGPSFSCATGTTNYVRQAVSMDVTKTPFAIGDKIRVTVELWNGNQATVGTFNIYHDPTTRTLIAKNYNGPTAANTPYQYGERTDFKVNIPFEVDI